MPLINPQALLLEKKAQKKAVGAFNIISLEMAHGVINAAEESNTPLILQLSSNALKWAGFNYIVPMIISAAKNSSVDVIVHLDHSKDINEIKKAIEYGFTSIMYDGSSLSLKDNIINSNKVITICKDKAFVEIEIGKIGGKAGDDATNNQPINLNDVLKFYNETKPDALAVAFGTLHGVYKGKVNLNYDFINEISNELPIPLVMHGTSGIPFDMIKKSIKSGITKVNVGTDLLIAYNNAIRKYLNDNQKEYDIRKINTPGINAITQLTKKYLQLFNSGV